MKSSRVILCVRAVFVVLIGMFALSTAWATEPINTDPRGLAIEGYDPIAYFTQGGTTKRLKRIHLQMDGGNMAFCQC